MRKNLVTAISCLLAVLFTVYIVLDTFVIAHVYQLVDSDKTVSKEVQEETQSLNAGSESTDNEPYTAAASETDTAVITDDQYIDDNISITIKTMRVNETDIYVADIELSAAEYLKTAFAQSAYGKNITDTTSNMAAEHDAILAINGDYYGVQESGYVIRNGVLYRSEGKDKQEDLVIYKDGSMEIINEDDIAAEELLEKGAANVLCFGPGLIIDGEITVSEEDEVDKAKSSNPRTAIGIIDDLHYIFVVADGRTELSEGLSLFELAQFMQSLGAETAYNLDGGGSSTMVFNGEIVNVPVSSSKKKSGHGSSDSSASSVSERKVSDIIYIGY